MGKAWQAGYEQLGDDIESRSEHSTKGSGLLQPPFERALQSVDSTLRFTPTAALGTRSWLHINQQGQARALEVDKHRLASELSLRYRDLLALDPSVPIPYPANLLIREKAMVVNLEVVRMIICANQVYVLSVPKEGNPRVAAAPHPENPFVKQLCRVLSEGDGGSSSDSSGLVGGSPVAGSRRGSMQGEQDQLFRGMPYELLALECALEAAVQVLSFEVAELEQVAYPAVERLAAAVSRQVLESVRGCKGAMNGLLGRVQRIRQEIEKIMADDADMQDMYLGRRAVLSGQTLPPQPPASLGPSRPHRTFGNLLALQQEPPVPHHSSGSSTPAHPRPASTSSLLAAAGSALQASSSAPVLAGQGLAGSSAGAAGAGGSAGTAGAGPMLLADVGSGQVAGVGDGVAGSDAATLSAAATASGHSVQPGSLSGSRAGHLWAKARTLQRAGVVVRVVRRLKRHHGKGSGNADGAGGAEGLEEGEEGSVIEEETVEQLPGNPLVDPHEVEDAEDLLEFFFLQLDYLLRRLMLLSDRTSATESLLSIEMDHRRNELVALDLFATCVTGAFAFVSMVAGIFGMNLPFGSWAEQQGSFTWAVLLMVMGGALLLSLIFLYIRKKRLMFISTVL